MQAWLMHQGVATSQGQKDLFLEALASGLTVTAACEAGGFSANCAYLLRGKDPAFADAWAKAKARGEAALVERLETEAQRRAVEGWDEPVFHEGREVGKKRRYSDTLLIFTLKGLAPDRYRERQQVEHTGDAFDGLTTDQKRAAAAALIAHADAVEGTGGGPDGERGPGHEADTAE